VGVREIIRNLIGSIPFFSHEGDKKKVNDSIQVVAGVQATDSAPNTILEPLRIDSSGHAQVDIAASSLNNFAEIISGQGEAGIAGNANSTADIGLTGEVWMVTSLGYNAAAARNPEAEEEDSAVTLGAKNITAAMVIDLLDHVVFMDGGQKITMSGGNALDAWDYKAYRVL
jgi:hypothetical protein